MGAEESAGLEAAVAELTLKQGRAYDPFGQDGSMAVIAARAGLEYVGVVGTDDQRQAARATLEAEGIGKGPGAGTATILRADSRYVEKCRAETADLLLTAGPFWARNGAVDDLAGLGSYPDFCVALQDVARDTFRILKPGAAAYWFLGARRFARNGPLVPIHHDAVALLRSAGFRLEDEYQVGELHRGYARDYLLHLRRLTQEEADTALHALPPILAGTPLPEIPVIAADGRELAPRPLIVGEDAAVGVQLQARLAACERLEAELTDRTGAVEARERLQKLREGAQNAHRHTALPKTRDESDLARALTSILGRLSACIGIAKDALPDPPAPTEEVQSGGATTQAGANAEGMLL